MAEENSIFIQTFPFDYTSCSCNGCFQESRRCSCKSQRIRAPRVKKCVYYGRAPLKLLMPRIEELSRPKWHQEKYEKPPERQYFKDCRIVTDWKAHEKWLERNATPKCLKVRRKSFSCKRSGQVLRNMRRIRALAKPRRINEQETQLQLSDPITPVSREALKYRPSMSIEWLSLPKSKPCGTIELERLPSACLLYISPSAMKYKASDRIRYLALPEYRKLSQKALDRIRQITLTSDSERSSLTEQMNRALAALQTLPPGEERDTLLSEIARTQGQGSKEMDTILESLEAPPIVSKKKKRSRDLPELEETIYELTLRKILPIDLYAEILTKAAEKDRVKLKREDIEFVGCCLIRKNVSWRKILEGLKMRLGFEVEKTCRRKSKIDGGSQTYKEIVEKLSRYPKEIQETLLDQAAFEADVKLADGDLEVIINCASDPDVDLKSKILERLQLRFEKGNSRHSEATFLLKSEENAKNILSNLGILLQNDEILKDPKLLKKRKSSRLKERKASKESDNLDTKRPSEAPRTSTRPSTRPSAVNRKSEAQLRKSRVSTRASNVIQPSIAKSETQVRPSRTSTRLSRFSDVSQRKIELDTPYVVRKEGTKRSRDYSLYNKQTQTADSNEIVVEKYLKSKPKEYDHVPGLPTYKIGNKKQL